MQKPSDETIRAYHTCFNSGVGRLVLGDLLLNSGFFDDDVKGDGAIAVRNFGVQILKRAGIGNEPEDMAPLINKMFEIGVHNE